MPNGTCAFGRFHIDENVVPRAEGGVAKSLAFGTIGTIHVRSSNCHIIKPSEGLSQDTGNMLRDCHVGSEHMRQVTSPLRDMDIAAPLLQSGADGNAAALRTIAAKIPAEPRQSRIQCHLRVGEGSLGAGYNSVYKSRPPLPRHFVPIRDSFSDNDVPLDGCALRVASCEALSSRLTTVPVSSSTPRDDKAHDT